MLVRSDSLIWWVLLYGGLLTLTCCYGLLLLWIVWVIGFVGVLVDLARLVCFIGC